MLEKPYGYDEAQVSSGYERLELGGHYLIIESVEKTETRTGKPMLAITFDTDRMDKQPRYYSQNARDNYYGGIYNMFEPYGDKTADVYRWNTRRLKGFITAVEESNRGYFFDWNNQNNLKTLSGKRVGGVFGEEEYLNNDNEVKTTVRLRYFCSINTVEEQRIPKLKELKSKPRQATRSASDDDYISPLDDEMSLPFDMNGGRRDAGINN